MEKMFFYASAFASDVSAWVRAAPLSHYIPPCEHLLPFHGFTSQVRFPMKKHPRFCEGFEN